MDMVLKNRHANALLLIFLMIFPAILSAEEQGQVLLYNPYPIEESIRGSAEGIAMAKPTPVSFSAFEKTVKSAIRTLENSMRGTCARQMETSISITAEGKWAVVGVSFTGAMNLIILNPERLKECKF